MYVEMDRGRSFAGLARYCLHDEGRLPTDERVEFAVVRNLATDNPHVAWRLMVAKDYQRERLKEEHGVGRGGSKDGQTVGHLVLAWSPEEAEAEQLDRPRMIAAAEGALRAIGASKREAIIVSHNDTNHPHLHVILCLIQDDGRLKKNWKEHEKLSRWALERERELHGEAIVKQREENWEARERGEQPRSTKKRPRHLYELEKAAASDAVLRQFAERHLRQLRELERRKVQSRRRHEAAERRLLESHRQRMDHRVQQHVRHTSSMRSDVRQAHRPQWRELLAEQEASRRLFDKNERTLRGRVANTFRIVDWRSLVGAEGRPARTAMSEAFDAARDEAARRRAARRKEEREKAALSQAQQRVERRQQAQLAQRHQRLKRLGRQAYLRASRLVAARRSRELTEEKRLQQELTRERNESMRASRERTWAARADERLTESRREKRRSEQPRVRLSRKERTDPLQVVGSAGQSSREAARNMDEAKVVVTKRKRRERKPRKERRGRRDR